MRVFALVSGRGSGVQALSERREAVGRPEFRQCAAKTPDHRGHHGEVGREQLAWTDETDAVERSALEGVGIDLDRVQIAIWIARDLTENSVVIIGGGQDHGGADLGA